MNEAGMQQFDSDSMTNGGGFKRAALRAAVLVGFSASVLLLVEYSQDGGGLCGEGGGCDAVRASEYSHILGISMPLIGAVYFAVLLAVSWAPGAWRLVFPFAALGGLWAVFLIGLQLFVIGAVCKFCVIVDMAAVLSAVLAFRLRKTEPQGPSLVGIGGCVAAAALLAFGAVFVHRQLELPRQATARREPPPLSDSERSHDRVNVVEFVDFECPACRAQYVQIAPLLADYASKLNVVVKNYPLQQHEHAVDAARAYCCAAEGGKGHDMADRLFRADQLSAADCEQIALNLGLDLDAFKSCVQSERVTERLQSDSAAATRAGVHGLPTLWIGDERFEGVQHSDKLRSSIERAMRQRNS